MNPAQLLAQFGRISDAPGAIPRLRQFILELAVRGKLVDQIETDEPAAVLLRRIETEKSRRVKAGAMKTERPLSHVRKDEEWFELPRRWNWVRLGTITQIVMGHSPPGETYNKDGEGIPLINGPVEFTEGPFGKTVVNQYTTAPTNLCEEGDLLLCVRGSTTGRTNVAGFKACIGRGVAAIRPFFDDQYIRLFIWRLRESIIAMGRGIAFPSVSRQQIVELPVPLPPLAEQFRIVAKVDELMGLCDRLEVAQAERESRRDRLAAASLQRLNQPADPDSFRDHARFHLRHFQRLTTRPDQIPQLRQTILSLAIRGKLVPQGPTDEPTQDLLGDRQVFPGSKNEPWELPLGWAWTSLKLIGETIGGGTPSKSNPEYWRGSVPWVSPKDMKVDNVQDAQDHISELAIENSSTRLIPTGSLLMVVRGMILAHSFPTAINSVPVTINQDMKAVRPFRSDLSRFLLLILKGLKPEVLRLVLRSTHGTCKLLTDDLFSLPLPIAPLAEQHRIVAKVEQLMALLDRLEAQLTTAQSTSHRLLDSFLHEALVPSSR
jgi:type I restriction enzyme, S subunit